MTFKTLIAPFVDSNSLIISPSCNIQFNDFKESLNTYFTFSLFSSVDNVFYQFKQQNEFQMLPKVSTKKFNKTSTLKRV